jgi:hypothetical protein
MKKAAPLLFCVGLMAAGLAGCNRTRDPISISGIKVVSTEHRDLVKTDEKGHTIEQRNIMERLKTDNTPGAIKHLYVLSAFSGQVILYSPVRGKVTSSGKRLSPSQIGDPVNDSSPTQTVDIGGHRYKTNELPGDDGTYGPSIEYLYWFDANGVYHQHYLGGGQIVHISDQPIAVKSIIINLDTAAK